MIEHDRVPSHDPELDTLTRRLAPKQHQVEPLAEDASAIRPNQDDALRLRPGELVPRGGDVVMWIKL